MGRILCLSCNTSRLASRFAPDLGRICEVCVGKCSLCKGILLPRKKCLCKLKPKTFVSAQQYRQKLYNDCVKRVRSFGGTYAELNLARQYANMLCRGQKGYYAAFNVLSPAQCDEWKADGNSRKDAKDWHKIGDDEADLPGRYQVVLGKRMVESTNAHTKQFPSYLQRLAELLLCLHPNIKTIEWSMLNSEPKCGEQPLHDDDVHLSSVNSKNPANINSKGRKQVKTLSYSILVSLEGNNNPTSLIMARNNKKTPTQILIPQGGFVMFRGDCGHAGASYLQDNDRGFIRIGTKKFPHDSNELAFY